jgi:hypothetical protein
MLRLSARPADEIVKGVLAFMLIGSYGGLFWRWRVIRKPFAENHSAANCREAGLDDASVVGYRRVQSMRGSADHAGTNVSLIIRATHLTGR